MKQPSTQAIRDLANEAKAAVNVRAGGTITTTATDVAVGEVGATMDGRPYHEGAAPGGDHPGPDEQATMSVESFLTAVRCTEIQLARLLQARLDGTPLKRVYGSDDMTVQVAVALSMREAVRSARIIHFDPAQVIDVEGEVARYVYTRVLGLDPDAQATEEQREYLHTQLPAFGQKVSLPEPMPFRSVFLAFGQGVGLRSTGLASKMGALNAVCPDGDQVEMIMNPPVHSKSCGLFVSDNGWVMELLATYTLRDRESASPDEVYDAVAAGHHGRLDTQESFMLIPWRFPEEDLGACGAGLAREVGRYWAGDKLKTGWMESWEMIPWLLRSLVHLVNIHRTVVLGEEARPRGYRNMVRPALKALGGDKTPPPFYRVRVRAKVLRERAANAVVGPHHKRSYRSDTRGHESCRVMRGEVPIAPKVEADLRKRRYRIYTSASTIPIEDVERLNVRGVGLPHPGEWVAILSWFRPSFISPADTDLPYVPSVHVVESDRLPKQRGSP